MEIALVIPLSNNRPDRRYPDTLRGNTTIKIPCLCFGGGAYETKFVL